MSGENTVKSPNKPMGRPGLTQEQIETVVGRLGVHQPRSEDYRKARRLLAMDLDRTESAIDKVFRAVIRPHMQGKPGPHETPAS